MQLSGLEGFALDRLMRGCSWLNEALQSAATRVLERVETRLGFYALIELPPGSCDLSRLPECEWVFSLRSQKRAGYFVCWPVEDSRLCLEAVISEGLDATTLASELLIGAEGASRIPG